MTIAAGAAPVGVIGAGPMADGIAGLAAQAGHEVHRCTATTIASLPACALVVDASRADLDETCEIFEELGRHQPTTTILGCASDELTVDDVAPMTVRPARVVGLHFVAPVPDNPIVEVVRCQATDADTVIGVMGLMTQWGRTPVRCASAPGLIVERLWRVVVGEAERVVDEGLADPATVDACLVAAGLPEGPLARADRLGLADELRLTRALWLQTQRHPRYAPTPLLRSLVSAGTLGVATGRGFLTYAASAAGVVEPVEPVEVPDARLAEKLLALPITLNPGQRCIALLVDEAVEIVNRGEAGPRDVDIAARVGLGMAVGPIEWGRQLGYRLVRDQLRELDAAYPGGRYLPSTALSEIE